MSLEPWLPSPPAPGSRARFVWNLGLEQRSLYQIRLRPAPGYAEQYRLTVGETPADR